VQTLNGIAPHLGRALQLRRTFAQQGAKLASLGETIDRLAVGVIVLDHEGGAIHVNRAAREITARNDGLWLDRSGVPHAAQRDADRALVKLCADVRLGDAGGIVRIPRRNEARPYAVMAAPLPARTALTGTQADATPVLILIHDPSAQVLGMPETIAAIFALPIATARLVAALAEGADVKSYAEQHAITTDAVKFHLKTAFAKTGLRSQTRLLQAVARTTSASASANRTRRRALPSPPPGRGSRRPPRPSAHPRSEFFTGSWRTRLPVAAKIALHSAGASGGTGGSPTPPQKSPLGTITVSTCGTSAMRSISQSWKFDCSAAPPSIVISPLSAAVSA
jgi:hypothetical protein